MLRPVCRHLLRRPSTKRLATQAPALFVCDQHGRSPLTLEPLSALSSRNSVSSVSSVAVGLRSFSSGAFNFDKESEETLESLSEHFEELLQATQGMEEADVSLSNGVLNVCIPDFGTYVINKQGPNKQIWLSSPHSGPAR
jgi:frataxin